MAYSVQLSSQMISCNFGRLIPATKHKNLLKAVKSVTKSVIPATVNSDLPQPVVRRTGNYQPAIWDNEFLQSLKSECTGERFNRRALVLKEDVKMMFNNAFEPLDQLELIDQLQRLAVAYHFSEEINSSLKNIYENHTTNNNDEYWKRHNLHATALKFRLLRQHGYPISSEVFKDFTENESFKECISQDVKGMLSLYEASYFSMEGEALMEEAWSFTYKILRECMKRNIDDSDIIAMHVKHALELPLQWRIPRFEATWYINMYQTSGETVVPAALLEFAKLDFNIVQGLNQEELKDLSRWWNGTGLGKKLHFIRERLAVSFLWGIGITSKPQDQYCRVQIAKTIQYITALDDIYDVYGTLDELELFTNVIERWDVNAMKELPDYMKICFLSLYNFVNEIVYDVLKEHNLDVLPYLKNAWISLAKNQLVEAQWYHSGYKPTLEEYLKVAAVTISAPVVALQTYIFTSNPVKEEAIEFIKDLPDILRLPYETFRLADDIGTASHELKRGDVPKAIQCYMSDTGVSEEVSRKHLIELMRKNWAKMMKFRFSDHNIPLLASSVEKIFNLTRVSHSMYNAGEDGFCVEDGTTKDRMFSLLVDPIPLQWN